MPIAVLCSCSAKLKVGDHLNGKQIQCPKCGKLIAVGHPAVKGAEPPPSDEDVLAQSELSDEERERLEEELEPDERLLWTGKPVVRCAFLRGWVVSFFLLAVAGIFLLFLLSVGQKNSFEGPVGLLLLIVFLLGMVGCVIAGLVWPFLRRWYAGLTCYALTSHRALAWVPDWFGKVSLIVYLPEHLGKLRFFLFGSGPEKIGDILFHVQVERRETRAGTEFVQRARGFSLVRNAPTVTKLIRETLLDPLLDKLSE